MRNQKSITNGHKFRAILAGAMACLLLSCASRAEALARVWVSSTGSNASPGTLASPVQTLIQAMTIVDAGGEINLRDDGDFAGGLIINKSVTIDGNGSQGAISHPGFFGIGIGAGASHVTLRNLSFNGTGALSPSVDISAGGTVNIERCTFSGSLTSILSNVSSAGYLKVSDCIFKGAAISGIHLIASGANNYATIENVQISNCGSAITALNGVRFTLRNSTLNSNVYGVQMSQTGSLSKGVVDNCMFTNNSTAVSLASLCALRVIETSFVQNAVLHQTSGGSAFESDGTNVKIANATEGPLPTPISNF
jgi:hypothetical protein